MSALEIRIAIFRNGLTVKRAARLAGMNPNRAGRILRGDYPARPGELEALGKVVGAAAEMR